MIKSMDESEIIDLESRVYSNVFKRLPTVIERGRGMYVWDKSGEKYLDMYAGIAVNTLGHAHPRIIAALTKQAGTLMHASNWFYTLPQLSLAEKLIALSGQEKVFYTNDGSESVECALKLALAASGKKKVIAMEKSFHGRSLGALSLTSGEKYRKPFKAFLGDVEFTPYGDADAVVDVLDSDTAAVFVEPIQGEAGVIEAPEGYLKALRDITEDAGVLLVVDEVQTGFGRTGAMFACMHENVKPDILCLAKAMGGGFPIGATLFNGIDFKPGQHGGTYLGNPLACAVAETVIDVIEEENLVENSRKQGEKLKSEINKLGGKTHGKGLMIGVDVEDGEETVKQLIEKNVLTIYSGNTVRVLPPLIVQDEHINEFTKKLTEVNI